MCCAFIYDNNETCLCSPVSAVLHVPRIILQAAAPQNILLDVDVAIEPEKTDPDVEVQVWLLLRLMQISAFYETS